MKKAPPLRVGWREWVAFPMLGVESILAKVDTGARSSSLHAENVQEVGEGTSRSIAFDVYPLHDEASQAIRCAADLVEYRVIKSSNGEEERRPVVRVDVQIKNEQWSIDLTLTNRDAMGFRMLLGREAIRGRFVVDPGRSYLQGEPFGISDAEDEYTSAEEGDE